MLILRSVSKRYKQELALDGLSFTVEPGQIAILIGPNGAGKTTANACIAGLLEHDGEVFIDGFPARSIHAKGLLGYVPEVAKPYDYLTVAEHIQFIALAHRLKGWRPKAAQLMDRFDMSPQANKLGKDLSKGMRQKLNLILAFLIDPLLLALDEPFVGLDPYAIAELKELIITAGKMGKAILISTHILASVAELFDKALFLSQGRLLAEKLRQDFKSGQDLEQVFFQITGTEHS